MKIDADLTNRSQSYSASTSLLRRVKMHDEQAWHRLVEIYAPFVYRWSRRFGLQAADAGDVVAEVFAALIADVYKFDKDGRPQSFRRWLATVTYRASLRIRSKEKSRHLPTGGTDVDNRLDGVSLPPEFEQQLSAKDEVDWLRQQVFSVIQLEFPSAQWQAFLQTVIEDRSPANVAESLGLSVWSVYKARANVLTRLRLELEGYDR